MRWGTAAGGGAGWVGVGVGVCGGGELMACMFAIEERLPAEHPHPPLLLQDSIVHSEVHVAAAANKQLLRKRRAEAGRRQARSQKVRAARSPGGQPMVVHGLQSPRAAGRTAWVCVHGVAGGSARA